jgi:hypothetical protein
VPGPSLTSAAADPSTTAQDDLHPGALRLRQTLVVALAVVSGATDAIGLLTLGGAFTSVMTGNLVLLGVSASSADGLLAIASGGAILAFCAGAALGARLAGGPTAGDRIWPRAVTVGLAVELPSSPPTPSGGGSPAAPPVPPSRWSCSSARPWRWASRAAPCSASA